MGDGITHSRPKTNPNFEVNNLKKRNEELRIQIEDYRAKLDEYRSENRELLGYKRAFKVLVNELKRG